MLRFLPLALKINFFFFLSRFFPTIKHTLQSIFYENEKEKEFSNSMF